MREIDEAMEAIGKRIGWIDTLRDDRERAQIRQQLEKVARVARLEAFASADGLNQAIDAWLRRMAEEVT